MIDVQFFYAVLLFKKILSEWGLWNNSWVKNLPVRPLAPRRKTPGQLYPTFRPPGQGQKFFKSFLRSGLRKVLLLLFIKILMVLKIIII